VGTVKTFIDQQLERNIPHSADHEALLRWKQTFIATQLKPTGRTEHSHMPGL
jgi:hypothetical protein